MKKSLLYIPLLYQASIRKKETLALGGVVYNAKDGEAELLLTPEKAVEAIQKIKPKIKTKLFYSIFQAIIKDFEKAKFPKNLTPVAFQNFIFENLLSADDDSLQFGDVEFIAPEEVEKAAEVQFRKEGIPNRLMRDPQRLGKIYYYRFPTFKTREQKLTALRIVRLENLEFELITPDKQGNWLDLTDNDFEELLPLCSKAVKAGKSEEAVFKLFSFGTSTNRDEWVYDFDKENLQHKIKFFVEKYNYLLANKDNSWPTSIKWSATLKNHFTANRKLTFKAEKLTQVHYRPFVQTNYYAGKKLSDRLTQNHFEMFGEGLSLENKLLTLHNHIQLADFTVFSSKILNDAGFAGRGVPVVPLYRYNTEGQRLENITDWGLKQFRARYSGDGSRGTGFGERGTESRTPSPEPQPPITKEDIFHYVYAVLHNPEYREKYKINLKRDFPRIPFYNDFWQWANWGKTLMDLHLNYEEAEEFPLERIENSKPKEFPKVKLRRDKKQADQIILDENTTLAGVPEAAWEYKLGNRSTLEWVLDQYKEKKPRDETIREKFNTYRFADYKEEVIVLLKKVCTVSLRTVEVVGEM